MHALMYLNNERQFGRRRLSELLPQRLYSALCSYIISYAYIDKNFKIYCISNISILVNDILRSYIQNRCRH